MTSRRRISHSSRSRWPLILALTVPPMVISGALLAPALLTDNRPETEPEDLWVGAIEYGPTSTAPLAEVEAVHDALHEIGELCAASDPDLAAIALDIDRIISFSQRYPVGRFPIDDETATASSLLLVTRYAVKDCAPDEVDRLDAGGQ